MYIINLFGEGIRYWICDLEDPLWEPLTHYKMTHQINWNDLLVDLSLLKKFGILHWSELAVEQERSGLLINATNRIEIKKGSRTLERLYADELMHSKTLFPKFRTALREFKTDIQRNPIIVQFETGLVAKFRIDEDGLLIDNLNFCLERPFPGQPETVFTTLEYKGSKLRKEREDTVVRGFQVLIQN
ncbi:MAG: hypothetical protein ACK45H_07680 [Bacteroidota bacterium]